MPNKCIRLSDLWRWWPCGSGNWESDGEENSPKKAPDAHLVVAATKLLEEIQQLWNKTIWSIMDSFLLSMCLLLLLLLLLYIYSFKFQMHSFKIFFAFGSFVVWFCCSKDNIYRAHPRLWDEFSYPYNEPRKPGSAIAVMVVAAYRMCFCSRYSVTSFTCKKTE